MFQCIQYNIVSNSNVGITGVSNHWTGIWNEIMECKLEWKRECSCTVAANLPYNRLFPLYGYVTSAV